MANELRSSAIGSTRATEQERLADSLEEDVPFMQPAMYDPGTAKRMHYKQTASREPASARRSDAVSACRSLTLDSCS